MSFAFYAPSALKRLVKEKERNWELHFFLKYKYTKKRKLWLCLIIKAVLNIKIYLNATYVRPPNPREVK